MDTFSNSKEAIIEKFNQIQNEILNIGWKGILEIYHPDTNCGHPEAFKIFQLYKEIYENMKKRLALDMDFPINIDSKTSNSKSYPEKNSEI